MNTKIEGDFYPLQHEEWLRDCQQLQQSARDVLDYIQTAAPDGNGFEFIVADLAADLEMHPGTMGLALKQLDAKGDIELEIHDVRVRYIQQEQSR